MGKLLFRILLAALLTLFVHALVYGLVAEPNTGEGIESVLRQAFGWFIAMVIFGVLLVYIFPIAIFHALINALKLKNPFLYVVLGIACFSLAGMIFHQIGRGTLSFVNNLTVWAIAGFTYGVMYVRWLQKYIRFWTI